VSHSQVENVSDLQTEDVNDLESKGGLAGTEAAQDRGELETLDPRGRENGADLDTATGVRNIFVHPRPYGRATHVFMRNIFILYPQLVDRAPLFSIGHSFLILHHIYHHHV
jgi:hypothetical protein